MPRILHVSCTVLALAWIALPSSLPSQGLDPRVATPAPLVETRGPVAAPVGIDRRHLQPEATAGARELAPGMQPQPQGTNVALMVVGAAGLVAGLLIEGNAGTAIAIGGAVIGLIGLYMYLR